MTSWVVNKTGIGGVTISFVVIRIGGVGGSVVVEGSVVGASVVVEGNVVGASVVVGGRVVVVSVVVGGNVVVVSVVVGGIVVGESVVVVDDTVEVVNALVVTVVDFGVVTDDGSACSGVKPHSSSVIEMSSIAASPR